MLEGKNREICLGGGVAFSVGLSIRFSFPLALLLWRVGLPGYVGASGPGIWNGEGVLASVTTGTSLVLGETSGEYHNGGDDAPGA
jgi:hypothetical protein